jgi:hypothetical protein
MQCKRYLRAVLKYGQPMVLPLSSATRGSSPNSLRPGQNRRVRQRR